MTPKRSITVHDVKSAATSLPVPIWDLVQTGGDLGLIEGRVVVIDPASFLLTG